MKRPFALFSGRFDPPNEGHMLAIKRMMVDYLFVVVPILDYPERDSCSAEQALAIFNHHFDMCLSPIARNKVVFCVNTDHFGQISRDALFGLMDTHGLTLDNCEYIAGNPAVLKHMRRLGVPAKFLERVDISGLDQYIFESTKLRAQMSETGESLKDIYRMK